MLKMTGKTPATMMMAIEMQFWDEKNATKTVEIEVNMSSWSIV